MVVPEETKAMQPRITSEMNAVMFTGSVLLKCAFRISLVLIFALFLLASAHRTIEVDSAASM